MGSLKAFKVDPKAEVEGVWVPVGGGIRIRLARAGNPKFREGFEALVRARKASLRLGALPREELEDIGREVMAKYIILGWENVTEEDEKTPIPYSEENAKRLLKEYPVFADLISEQSQDISLFQEQESAEAESVLGEG